jgi:pimeloyl-ACP methyl ester carboxylesterase
MWKHQVEYFKKVFRIITYDLRGFGNSSSGDNQCTIDTHADDLNEIIKRLNIVQPVVCGLSMGGYILLRALELYQHIFKAVILSSTKSEADTNVQKINRFNQIKQIKSGKKKIFFETFLKNALIDATYTNNKEAVNLLMEIMNKQNELSITGALLTLASRTDTTESLSNIKIPALIIVGVEDKLTPPETAHSLHKNIKYSKLELIPDSGHFPNIENPERFNKVIEEFINTLI